MDKNDVKVLYDAFVSLCDYIEKDTSESCSVCPLNKTCYSSKGDEFADSLKRIRTEVSESEIDVK